MLILWIKYANIQKKKLNKSFWKILGQWTHKTILTKFLSIFVNGTVEKTANIRISGRNYTKLDNRKIDPPKLELAILEPKSKIWLKLFPLCLQFETTNLIFSERNYLLPRLEPKILLKDLNSAIYWLKTIFFHPKSQESGPALWFLLYALFRI